MTGIAVVGAGLAGLNAARALRALGYDGRIVLVGAEEHAPYDRPPLSKGFLAGAVPLGGLSLAAPEDGTLDLDVRPGERAIALHVASRRVELATGELIGGEGVVIATGARARDLPGPALGGTHTLRTVEDALVLRGELTTGARLVVVGGGFVGVEVAATARELGVEVTLVEVAATPLAAALGPELGRLLAEMHADHGVRLVTGVPVAGLLAGDVDARATGHPRERRDGRQGPGEPISGTGRRVRAVRLADGRELEADAVLVAVGSQPEVEWLAGSGLDVEGGILTDAAGATGAAGVVATGDCTRRFDPLAGAVVRQEHWTNALQHPQSAVATLLGAPPPPQPVPARVPYVWSDQYGTRLQFAGHHQPGDTFEVVEGSLAERSFVAVYRRDGVDMGVVAIDSPRGFVRRRRELAASLPG